jgi:hypothetical protein
MKYLLIALVVYANGDTSGLFPTSWFDDEAACEARGEDFASAMMAGMVEDAEDRVAQAAYFDCLELSPLEIAIMNDAMPFGMPRAPQ